MDIVDSQVHLWAADTPSRPWPPGRAQEAQKPYPIGKEAMLFQMDLAGRGVCEWLGWSLTRVG